MWWLIWATASLHPGSCGFQADSPTAYLFPVGGQDNAAVWPEAGPAGGFLTVPRCQEQGIPAALSSPAPPAFYA